MLQIGAEIANYEVVGVLGDGGMAVVYRVRHRVLLTEHALKVLEARWVRDDEVRQRFLLEARTQARLIHPHIVRVTDVVVEPGIAGAVMDLADGGDLGGHLKRRGPVDVGLAVRWTVELLDALAVVHAAGVVHRDIKPSNVLLRSGVDTGLIAQVTDFGVARQLTQDMTRHTRTIGTYAYMAPEQVLHPKSVDGRADLFSLGAVLHELLVGSPVFERDTDFATQSAVLHERPARLPEGARLRAPGLEAVVDRALAKDPEQRFESAAAFRDALLAAWCPLDWRRYAGSGWAAKLAMGEALAASERRVEPARVDPSPTVAPQPAHPAASGSVEARLVVVGGALKEDVAHVDLHATPGLTLSVGRGRDNEVCVRNDARVNRVHAKLQRTASGWRIADNNSANGTFVDGAPVADAPLRHGSVIVVGETRLRFELLAEGGASAGSVASAGPPRVAPLVVVAARLVVLQGQVVNREQVPTASLDLSDVEGAVVSLGRSRLECDLVIKDDFKVSRVHAKLVRKGGCWVIEDNRSANGVLLDGVLVTSAALRPGAVLTLGDTRFALEVR